MIRRRVRAAFESGSTSAAKLEAARKISVPYKSTFEAVVRSETIDSWRQARTRARKAVARAHTIGFVLRGSEIQETLDAFANADLDGAMFDAQVQELAADEVAYDQIVREYRSWAEKLGEEVWQQKVKAAQGSIERAVDQGWGLSPFGEYRKGAEKVSAFEATGGRGGAENVKPGYSYVEIKPGLMNELSKDLQKWGYSGYQLERLARTEYTRAMNDGLLSIYQEDDAVVGYEWSAIADFNTCVECAMMDGVVMDRDDPRLAFYEPPLHANCRCELLPIFAWEMREPDFDQMRTATLYDVAGKSFEVDYYPNRIDPDFLKTIRPANDAAGIRRQLMPKARAEGLRNKFKSTDVAERFATWLHPRNARLAAETAKSLKKMVRSSN